MENASKALLIAAGILIVIILITIGIRISSSTNGIDETTKQTGKAIEDKTAEATDKVIEQIRSYVGYYADVDADGVVDGIIYDQKGLGKGNYSISQETKIGYFGENYYVTKTSNTGKEKFDVLKITNESIIWKDANEKYNNPKNKWRLPNKNEWQKFNEAVKNSKIIIPEEMSKRAYWSSEEVDDDHATVMSFFSNKYKPYNKEIRAIVALTTKF